MANEFNNQEDLPDQLVAAVEDLYNEWASKPEFQYQDSIPAPFDKPYFIGQGYLTKNAGLIQIRHYAEAVNDEKLLAHIDRIKQLLKETKAEFYKILTDPDKINYFG